MNLPPGTLYALTGCALFIIGLHALFAQPHLFRKILSLNIMGSGVFLVLVAMAYRGMDAVPDPVPHAMVLTGIIVSVSGTAVALALAGRVRAVTGKPELPEQPSANEGEA